MWGSEHGAETGLPRSRGRRRRRPRARLSAALAAILNATGVGALLCAHLLVAQRADVPPPHSPPRPDPSWAARFPVSIDRVTESLAQLPLRLPQPIEDPRGSGKLTWIHRHYELTLTTPEDPTQLEQAFRTLADAAPQVEVRYSQDSNGAEVQVGIDGLLTHSFTLYWLGHRPRVAILLTDLGDDLRLAREIVGMSIPLTLAVQPVLPFSRQVGELAELFSREVLVQLPDVLPSAERGPRSSTRGAALSERVSAAFESSLVAIPQARGAVGAAAAFLPADPPRTRAACERLKQRGLFLVDPGTGGDSPVCRSAAEVRLPCAGGDIVLDEVEQHDAVALQVESMITLVRTRGDVLATARAGATVLDALRAVLPRLTRSGIEVVPVSTVLTDRSFTRR